MTDYEKTIVMAYTGKCMLHGEKLDLLYRYVSRLLGHPVFTHDLADHDVWEEIKAKSKDDFIALCVDDYQALCATGEYFKASDVERMFEDAQTFSDGEYSGYYADDLDLNKLPRYDFPGGTRAKWVPASPFTDTYMCSKCNYNIPDIALATPFCPWCGSPMEEVDEDED